VTYFRGALERLGVRVVERARPGDHEVTIDATPGRPVVPELAGPDGPEVVLAEDVLASRVDLAGHGDRVAVLGSGIFAGETALFLAAAGKTVTLLATGERAMADAHPLVAGTTALRLAGHGGTTITGVLLRGAAGGHLDVTVDGEPRRLGPFDLLVSGLGWTAPPASPTAVGDTWDAFAQRLLVAHAARLARLV
jgi:pyruvate/2-oxoglutarate dehydrogenase complex dihydrolipoamide dehydrogenase (E3) component